MISYFMLRFAAVILVLLAACAQPSAQPASPPPKKPTPPPDLATGMMNATVKLVGPASANLNEGSAGTGFIVGRPMSTDPSRHYFVLVTAAHVFESIAGEVAAIIYRSGDGESFKRVQQPVRIRQGTTPLWTKHPQADVAAMYVSLSNDAYMPVVPMNFLATDEDFKTYQIRPGDEVLTIGYPYGLEANELGFGLLRSGRVASYPLVPASTMKSFLVDFSVFGGNSGGAIFINESARAFGGGYQVGGSIFRVLGLVSQQSVHPTSKERLNVAIVVHSQFIKEVVESLRATP